MVISGFVFEVKGKLSTKRMLKVNKEIGSSKIKRVKCDDNEEYFKNRLF